MASTPVEGVSEIGLSAFLTESHGGIKNKVMRDSNGNLQQINTKLSRNVEGLGSGYVRKPPSVVIHERKKRN
jgi:hypothetical protein